MGRKTFYNQSVRLRITSRIRMKILRYALTHEISEAEVCRKAIEKFLDSDETKQNIKGEEQCVKKQN